MARHGNPDRDGLRIELVNAPSDTRRTGHGLLAGLITGFLAVGIGQLVAGIARPQSSPVAAVGSLAIDFTPPPVKNFAISAFGSHDKFVLVSGVVVILAVFAAVIGALAMRRLGYGLAGLAVFAVIGLVAALTRPNAELVDALPTLLGAAAGAFVLTRLVRAAEVTPALAGTPARASAPRLDPFGPAAPPGAAAVQPGDAAVVPPGSDPEDPWRPPFVAGPPRPTGRPGTPGQPRATLAGRRGLGHQGIEPVHHAERVFLPGRHRADPPGGLTAELGAADPRHGQPGDQHQLR